MITLLSPNPPTPDNSGLVLIIMGSTFVLLAAIIFVGKTLASKKRQYRTREFRPPYNRPRWEQWEHNENPVKYHLAEANYGRTRCSVFGSKVSK